MSLHAVKSLVRKLFQITIELMGRDLSYDLSFPYVDDHMIVCSCIIVKNYNENLVISDPAAISKRIRKHFIAHC